MMADPNVLRSRVQANLAAVRGQIVDACRLAGRDPNGVRLVGVTKYVSAVATRSLVEAGCRDLGESRPQALWAKADALAGIDPPPRWHMIGHLQRNKVERTVGLVALLHSLDSLRLLEAVEAEAARVGHPCDALVEVNISAEPNKTGIEAVDLAGLLARAAECRHLRIRGLMGMATAADGPDASAVARGQFARLRELRDTARLSLPTTMQLEELSMGMSGDFVEAILEGSTIIRIGSALWEGVES